MAIFLSIIELGGKVRRRGGQGPPIDGPVLCRGGRGGGGEESLSGFIQYLYSTLHQASPK